MLLLATTSCSLLPGDDPSTTTSSTVAPSAPTAVVTELRRVLDRRAESLLARDRTAFERTLTTAQTDAAFAREQATYFDNLAQLPLAELAYTVRAQDLVREGDAYRVVVATSLQLDGFDAVPVTTRDRFLFVPGRRDGVLRIASTSDPEWEQRNGAGLQPWDLGPIEVRNEAGILTILDAGSAARAADLLYSVRRGIADVSALVPYDWSHTVVVYALSDPAFLDSIEDPPGGDPELLDGVAFPVYADAPDGGAPVLASMRFALNPRTLGQVGPEVDRLVRHELTHVALGEHDDQVPVWLSEGLAEYVSAQPMAPEDRSLPTAALAFAEAQPTTMPADETFNDADAGEHYGLAWWACEYLASSYGPDVLWSLLDALADGSDPDTALQDRVGLDQAHLARRAARLLVATYR
ncbi:unannotated protein [freshwater metagenome]|uniref:Unannotated protein n=1 Tax=freshwater metagenome TaxID=449393 RepID=A0A6J6PGM4_9ZZZZ